MLLTRCIQQDRADRACRKRCRAQKEEKETTKGERIIVVVRSPCQENYPADAHPSAHKSVLESANPAWTRIVHLPLFVPFPLPSFFSTLSILSALGGLG